MEASIQVSAFRKMLGVVRGAIPAQAIMPVMACCVIHAGKNGYISLTGGGVEMGAQAWATGTVSGEGDIAVPAKQLYDAISRLPDNAVVTIANDGKVAHLRANRTRYALPVSDPEDHPGIPEPPEAGVVRFDMLSKHLKHMIETVLNSASDDDTRPILNAVSIKFHDEVLSVAATNTHVLSEIKRTKASLAEESNGVSYLPNEPFSVILPLSSVRELARILSDDDEDSIEVCAWANSLVVNASRFTFYSGVVAGEFPHYERLIRKIKECKYDLIVTREALLEAIRRVGMVSKVGKELYGIYLELNEFGLKVSCNSSLGYAEDEIEMPGAYEEAVSKLGTHFLFACNPDYLQELVSVCESTGIRISIKSYRNMVHIRPLSQCDTIHIMSPIVLEEELVRRGIISHDQIGEYDVESHSDNDPGEAEAESREVATV